MDNAKLMECAIKVYEKLERRTPGDGMIIHDLLKRRGVTCLPDLPVDQHEPFIDELNNL